jgi:hypothetical protein
MRHVFACLAGLLWQGALGTLELSVTENGAPAACRIHLQDAAGKPVIPPGLPTWKDHVDTDAPLRLDLAPGRYHLEIERGPESSSVSQDIVIAAGASTKVTAELKRLVDLSSQGWWSGELHVHRPLKDIDLLMRAEDLHVAPVITWWNKRDLWSGKEIPALEGKVDGNRFYHIMAGEDEREGGALMFFGLPRPLAIQDATREYPSPARYVALAKKTPGVHVDIEKPFWWDTSTWIATGQVDTIGIAVNHFCRSYMSEKEAWGKARPEDRLPPPLGVGYWVQEIYYHVLNCGLRIAPSAGSASGVLPNPMGYNRAYVHLDGEPSCEKWFEGLRAGRSFVTNGPLLRVTANGRLPGEVFRAEKELSIELEATLEGREPVQALEIIRDGKIERKVPVKEGLGRLEFRSSGWFLVRCISTNPKFFRFASTAPFYVEIGESKRRISRASATFFADWVDERMARVPLQLKDAAQLAEVLGPHRKAKEFWAELAKRANAD